LSAVADGSGPHGAPRPKRIRVSGVRKSFGRPCGRETLAIADVDLAVQEGGLVALVGPSGCGKSTLLELVAGLISPDTGTILVDGQPVDAPGRIGYMPQRDLLLPWRTVIGNVLLGPDLRGEPRAESRPRAERLLPVFGLEGFADAWPTALSGGMRQRAALLRTVLAGSDTLLLDEPFGALDALTRYGLQDWLLEVRRQFRWTVLFVTHDVSEAIYLADQVVALTPRPARVALTLDVDLPRPRKRRMVAGQRFGELEAQLLEALGF